MHNTHHAGCDFATLSYLYTTGTHGPTHVDTRIDAFLSSFARELRDMSEDEFSEHKDALVSAKQQQDGQLYAESDRHWDHIVNRRYNFRSREQEVAAVGALTKEAMVVRGCSTAGGIQHQWS